MLKIKHLFFLIVSYLIGGLDLASYYSIVLCYFLFAKGYAMQHFFPSLVKLFQLTMELKEQVINKPDSQVNEKDIDMLSKLMSNNKYRQIHFEYYTDREMYERRARITANLAFIFLPSIYISTRQIKSEIKTLKKELNKSS